MKANLIIIVEFSEGSYKVEIGIYDIKKPNQKLGFF
jgi:hypothetical protein